jgi:predicted nucleotidyltransferase component of viral defense system
MNTEDLIVLAKKQGMDISTLKHEMREVRFLEAIAKDPVLALHLAFKGGTALRLVYGSDRYSDDLDFDRVRSDASKEELLDRLRSIARDQDLEETDTKIKRNTIFLCTREKRGQRNLIIEVSLLECSSEGMVVKNVVTPVYPASVNILTYPMSILLSGKMLAVLERKDRTPRDLYDLFWLLSRDVQEDASYLEMSAAGDSTDRRLLYGALRDRVEDYADDRIASELCAMLPRGQRTWVRGNLKERVRELLTLRISALG